MALFLHISDLHFVKNAASYNTEVILRREAAKRVKGVPTGEKFLIVTGDFHSFKDRDYEKAEAFLRSLAADMGLDMTKDVFVVPGNHDVGNDSLLKPLLEAKDPKWKAHNKSALIMLKQGDRDYLDERLQVFLPYCAMVQRLGIYDPALGEDYPARTHLRSWRGKLNILHLNTALLADGINKTDQMTDADTAADSTTWQEYYKPEIPSLAIGHNSYYDLNKNQRKDLAGTFDLKNVSAYLCGDRHRTEQDTEQKNITIASGHRNERRIPNLVSAKSIADGDDNYSEIGFCWHQWDESTDQVSIEYRKWTRDTLGKTVSGGEVDGYEMHREKPDGPETAQASGTGTGTSPIPDGDDAKLRTYLADVLKQKRDSHPSFQLLKVDEIDHHLYPNVEGHKFDEYEEIPPQAKVSTEENEGEENRCPVWDIIRESWSYTDHRSVVIIGEGGIGKTVTLFSITRPPEGSPVPALYVPMYELVDKDGNLFEITDYIKAKYKQYGDRIESLATKSWEDRPQLLLLLDGFNEVAHRHRRTILAMINDWHDTHPGTQLIAVSRPMDGINLSKELAGDPIPVTLALLDDATVRSYLKKAGRKVPSTNVSVWKDLKYPLFLNLYIKTGRLMGKTAAGYPLHVMDSDSGGALIWNYLQRELLRHSKDKHDKSEDWVLHCSVANEYVLPYIAYQMVSTQRMDISFDQVLDYTKEALSHLFSESLPRHLKDIWDKYRRQHSGNYPGKEQFPDHFPETQICVHFAVSYRGKD